MFQFYYCQSVLHHGYSQIDAGVIAAVKTRYVSRLYERALYLMERDDTCKLYQVDVLRAFEWVSDMWDKVHSTMTHNCWCSINICQISYQNSEANALEENKLHTFIEQDNCICTAENWMYLM